MYQSAVLWQVRRTVHKPNSGILPVKASFIFKGFTNTTELPLLLSQGDFSQLQNKDTATWGKQPHEDVEGRKMEMSSDVVTNSDRRGHSGKSRRDAWASSDSSPHPKPSDCQNAGRHAHLGCMLSTSVSVAWYQWSVPHWHRCGQETARGVQPICKYVSDQKLRIGKGIPIPALSQFLSQSGCLNDGWGTGCF